MEGEKEPALDRRLLMMKSCVLVRKCGPVNERETAACVPIVSPH